MKDSAAPGCFSFQPRGVPGAGPLSLTAAARWDFEVQCKPSMQAGVEWKVAEGSGASGEEGMCRVSLEELGGKCCESREFAGDELGWIHGARVSGKQGMPFPSSL